ncbi:peptidase C14 [Streptomyces sp. NBC_00669]|uniref:peptidase C14 n=1 Tax=Streptomyces sp. NBC_00669 TaxID=2976011 RepID=UPI002E36AD66|nr:peptidase C14 [Streptomyces sp. NBC_00669]
MTTTRRHLLRSGGIGAAAVAAGALTTVPAQAAAPAGSAKGTGDDGKSGAKGGGTTGRPATTAATVADLLATPSKSLRDGTVTVVAGYRAPGDGGGMTVRWDAGSTLAPNGGTVLRPNDRPAHGRWRRLHDGVLDFRGFGLFDASAPADDALDAMVDDPSVHRVEAHTDLLFQRRHTYHRSRLALDFGGHTVHTGGIERNTHDNPFGAVLFFQGTVTGDTVSHALSAEVIELTDAFPVPDSGAFKVGQWWAVQSDEVAGGGSDERELQKMVEVTEIIDGTHIRVDYLNGWPLAAGRKLTWRRVEPVVGVRVDHLVFLGAGQDTGAVDDEYTGSHPVAYEYAVDCDVSGIQATGTFWPVIMRRWCTRYRTIQCGLKNPPTVMYGGAGYLTQQIYCLYGHVADCTTSNVRHLNDLTASAYCQVVNCHGDGDDEGGNPFTTHGQYEHDLLFDGNSGLMDIANSGAQWGDSAKRITVRNHVCSWFTANTKITDLTLENVKVIARPTFDPAGTLVINADGAQLRGCTASFFAVAQQSARSTRPTTVTDCTFDLPKASVLVQTPVTAPVHFVRTTFTGLDGNVLRGSGPVHFTDCRLVGSPKAAPLAVGASEVTVDGGSLTDTGIALSAVRDQRISVGGGTALSGTNTAKALLSRDAGTGATVTWDLADLRSSAADADTAHVRVADGHNRYTAVGARLTGGQLALAADAFADTSSLLHTACTEDGVDRKGLPADGKRISATTGNLIL